MSTQEIYIQAKQAGVKLYLNSEGKLAFKAAKGALTSELKQTISAHKESLIEFLQNLQNEARAERIEAVPRTGRLIPSAAQTRMLLASQMASGSIYNMPFAFRLSANLSTEVIKEACLKIVERHEVLRSRYLEDDLGFYCEVDPVSADCIVEHHDQDIAQAEAILQHEVTYTFDLENEHPFRVHLIHCQDDQKFLMVNFHHICSDGWSVSVFFQELEAIYNTKVTNESPSLEELPIQYLDYANWHNQKTFDQEKCYWKKQLRDIPQIHHLPTNFRRPQQASHKGALVEGAVSQQLMADLKNLANKQGATLFQLFETAFAVLISRWSGQHDVVIGTSVAGRLNAEVGALIGFFVNSVVLRSELDLSQTFLQQLECNKRMITEAFNHQDLPFEQVVEQVNPARSNSYHPLYQIAFSLQNKGDQEMFRLQDVAVESIDLTHHIAKFDLFLSVREENDGGGIFNFEYATDLFERERIEQLRDSFNQLLEHITKEPACEIGKLKILGKPETERILNEFNDTAVAYSSEETIISRFEQQVSERPEAIAVTFAGESLTYGALNERANRLAHLLTSKGLESQEMVGLCLDRSLDMLIAILGILKAGGAYVPIDSEYPEERIRYIFQDTGLRLLLSNSTIKLTKNEAVEVLLLDQQKDMLDQQPTDNPKEGPDPGHLAYVIYTSGSTGKPKGVLLEHSGIVNLVEVQSKAFGLTAGSTTLQFASTGFDASISEIFNALATGGHLVIPQKEDLLSSERFGELLTKHNIEIATLPASFQLVMKEQLTGLKTVVSAGEALNPEMARYLQQAGVRLINAYGPTEGTVCATISEDPLKPDGMVTIGKPMANVQVYILDANHEPVPIGVTGELCIGGAQVARGYLNRPELTDRQFIDHPFDRKAGKVYKTGDMARWFADGSIEYIGRADSQVKVRGYRIELGEVERVLQGSDLVNDGLVVVHEDDQGNKALVGYVVPNASYDKDGLQAYLKEKLPAYMVPSVFVPLDSFPLNANGKVDRKSLPEPVLSVLASEDFVAARNETEARLALLWQELLKVELVGIHTNFFELGGHSLLATRMVVAINKQMKAKLSIRDIFNHPTIAKLAELIGETIAPATDRPKLKAAAKTDLVPLSFSQERLWFIDKLEGSTNYHIPLVYRLSGEIEPELLEKSFFKIVERHEVLRTVFEDKEGYAVQNVKPASLDFSYEPEAKEIEELIAHYINQPFNLTEDEMLRVRLLKVSEDEHVLVLVLHHIAFDGWSAPVLIQELQKIYHALVSEHPVKLPELPVQYTDFSIWQHEYLQKEVLEDKSVYWKKKLNGVEALNLPTDFTRPSKQSSQGDMKYYQLDKALHKALKTFSLEQEATLYMTLLAAFKVLLYRYSGQQNICVGSPIANRLQQELEPLIGFFANTLALRTDLGESSSFQEVLSRVKATTLEGYIHQDVPFEHVVNILGEERDQSRSSLFQVVFALQNNESNNEIKLGEAVLSPIEAPHTTSKFDLTFSFDEDRESLLLSVEYCTELFLPETIDRMYASFIELLKSIVENPAQPINMIDILSTTEEELLLGLNPDATSYPSGSVGELFEAQARLRPEATALSFGSELLTYSGLNTRANQLAHYLIGKGVKPGHSVALCADRSVELIVGILGIVKAGGAYVPVDADNPDERIGFILSDTEASLLLTTRHYSRRFEGFSQQQVHLDEEELFEDQPTGSPSVLLSADSLLYIMYTSGSTGQPKGVLIPHRAVSRLIFNETFDFLNEQAVLYQYAPVAFDAATFEIWGALLKGGRVAIAPPGIQSLESLSESLRRHEVTVLWLTAGLFHQAAELHPELFEGLDYLLAGGDSIRLSAVKKVLDRHQGIIFINGYGPTESTTFAVTHRVQNAGALKHGRNLIGRPIGHTRAFVVDPGATKARLVPQGCYGELCLAGPGLALGYLNQPQLTAEKFIDNPYGEPAFEKLYRTGDLVRWLSDGTLEFMGRADSQVKVRGYRIELGEVERVLQGSDLVNDGLVVVHEDDQGNKALVGYVVPNASYDKDGLQAYLKEKLPAYMVPSVFVPLDSFPLNANGKVDRKSLPEPVLSVLASEDFVAARNETEARLALLWQELLKVEQVGIHTNFFELGGHSLLATRMIAAINKQMKAKLSIRDIFSHPTIAKMAALIEDSSDQNSGFYMPEVVPAADKDCLPLTRNESGLWYLYKTGRVKEYNMPFGYEFSQPINVAHLAKAISTTFAQHESLSSVIFEDDNQAYRKRVSEDQILRQIKISDESAHDWHSFSNYEFDLEKECPFKIRVVQRETSTSLYILIHHIAADGQSVSVLLQQIDNYYRQLANGKELPDPNRNIALQISDYALWQDRVDVQDVFDKLLTAQVEKLKYAPEAHQLPVTKQGAVSEEKEINQFTQLLSVDVRDKIYNLAKSHGCTPYAVVMTAFGMTVCRLSNEASLVVGIPTLGRIGESLQNTVGYFVNPVPLFMEFISVDTVSQAIQNTHTELQEALTMQALPFEQLVSAMPDSHSRYPVFQMMVGWLDEEWEISELCGTQVSPIKNGTVGNKFDLSLNISPGAKGLSIHWEFDPSLYGGDQVKGWAQKFNEVIEWMCASPSTPLQEYNHLPATGDLLALEYDQFLEGFYASCAEYPEQVAAVYGDEKYTYKWLDQEANRLANYFSQQQIGKDKRVMILLEQSVDQLIAILATIKIGGTYIPLSANSHIRRIQDIIEDSAVDIVFTEKNILNPIKKDIMPVSGTDTSEAPVFLIMTLEEWRQQKAVYATTFTDVKRSPDTIANMIYTSGSTGKPKGVCVPDRAVMRLVDKNQNYFNFSERPVIAHASNFSFDAATFEIWGALLNAGKLVAIPYEALLDQDELERLILSNGVKGMFLTTALFNRYSEESSKTLANLDTLLFGGEACSVPNILSFMDKEPQVRLVHIYGPTEVCTFSVFLPLDKEAVRATGIAPIGHPIKNTTMLVINKLGQSCGIGEAGELWLGGPGVALGYLNRPEETSKSFVHSNGEGYYRTGDIVRLDQSGALVFVGREDHQVKVRGFRIETDAIDRCLKDFSAVKASYTTVLRHENKEAQLISFLIVEDEFDQRELLDHLHSVLPNYMVPALFHQTDSFPLNKNGKVDVKVLMENLSEAQTKQNEAVSLSPTELLIADIWKELLGEEVLFTPESNFFELGGSSLSLMKMRSKVNETFGVNISIAEMIKKIKLKELASYLDLLQELTTDIEESESDSEENGTF
jgi:amino acid adenylation domain-containing protein